MIKPTISMTQKDAGFWDKLKARIKKAPDMECAVGFPVGKASVGAPHYDDGKSIIQVAIENNFGTKRIPRRPFMDMATPKIQKKYKKRLASLQKRINSGKLDYKAVLQVCGLEAESEIRLTIDTGTFKPNSPETIKKKKSSKPLIDTGDMRKYVTHVVRKA